MESLPSWVTRLLHIRLVSGPLPTTIWVIVGVGVAILLLWQVFRSDRSKLARQVPIMLVCGGFGLLVMWLLSEKFMVFGVSLGWPVIMAAAACCALLGLLVTTIVHARRARRLMAAVLIPFVLVSTALRIDSIYGEYQTIGSLIGYSSYHPLSTSHMQKGTLTVDEWLREVLDGKLPPAAAHGKVYSVDISNTASGFRARTAAVYMPPAALSDTPPELPVLVMLAGQPGNPDRVFSASGIAAILDQYAKAHHGLAPIVISPDQNGDNTVNSLCADTTKVGRAETYLTVDVPRWIKAHLPVSRQARDWAIGGWHVCHPVGTAAPGHIRLHHRRGRRAEAHRRIRGAYGRRIFQRRPQRL